MHLGRIPHNAFFTYSRPCMHSCPRPRLKPRLSVQQTIRPGGSRQFSSSPNVYYATHHDTPSSSLLSQTLDQRQRATGSSQPDNVGPFTLGMTQPAMGVEQPMKKWSELDTKGKSEFHLLGLDLCWVLWLKLCNFYLGLPLCYSDAFYRSDYKPHGHRYRGRTHRYACLCPCIRALRQEFTNRPIRGSLLKD